MNEFGDSHNDDAFAEFLRRTMGDQAEELLNALRAQGVNPGDFAKGMSVEDLSAAFSQLETVMSQSTDPVNWSVAVNTAKQSAYGTDASEPTAAQASEARQAMTVADLWLDAVTECDPGVVDRKVWSRYAWVDSTIDTWKRFAEPVVRNIVRAFLEATDGRMTVVAPLPGLMGNPAVLVERLLAMAFAHSIGQALGGLAKESFGSTDVGLPLGPVTVTALLPGNIEAFAKDLEIPHAEVVQFLAVRECAHHRLFASVPWLASDIIHAVESYSGEIALDVSAIARAVEDFSVEDLQASVANGSSLPMLNGGLFATTHTERQAAALERLETLLALVEGWVELVTRQATAPYLPHYEALTELMRRRRASGAPAEAVLGDLLGLKLRPRQARGAAQLMSLVEAEQGRVAREALWRHPDFIPSAQDLHEPESFLLLRDAAGDDGDEFDADLERLLDGTLGWAEGLEPEGSSDTPPDNS